jgi:hypothetical protein
MAVERADKVHFEKKIEERKVNILTMAKWRPNTANGDILIKAKFRPVMDSINEVEEVVRED